MLAVRACALIVAFVAATPARALDVDQVQWGFDGKIVRERFNLLSVRIANRGTEAFDGDLQLRRARGFDPVDAPIIESVYLAPGTSRWVQFYPYISNPSFEVWTLGWGSGKKSRTELPQPNPESQGAVLLEAAGDFSLQTVAIKRMSEELFPSRSTACDALNAVVLDHEPRWNDAQQQAFLEWVRRGGHVHVLYDGTRKFPRFTGPLVELTGLGPRHALGAGVVHHHEFDRGALTESVVEREILRVRSRRSDDEAAEGVGQEKPANLPDQQANATFNFDLDVDSSLLRDLRGLTRAEHNWVLIHLLAGVYLLLVFPGCWKLGQERVGDYRLVFGSLLATIGLFSLLFLWIGSRGAGEATALDAIVVARPLDANRYDVVGWSNAFVVAGGDYTLTHDGQARIYGTGQSDEEVRGSIRNGAQAGLVVDMPPFSTRTLLHRAVVEAPQFSVTIREIATGMESRAMSSVDPTQTLNRSRVVPVLRQLVISKAGAPLDRPIRLAAVYGPLLYQLTEQNDEYRLSGGGEPVATALRTNQGFLSGFARGYAEQPTDRKSKLAAMFVPAVQRSLDALKTADLDDFDLATDRVRLLVYVDLPPEFRLKSDLITNQSGCCLYSIDLPVGTAP